LRVGLSAPSSVSRGVSAELLGHFDAVAAVPELVALFEHDPVLGVRVRAADALHRIGSPHALSALTGCLDASQSPALRAATARALSTVGPGTAQDDLVTALASGDHGLARAAAGTLSLGGPAAVRRLAAVASSAGVGSDEAIEALAALGHAEVFSGVAA
jgi:HEAT repeat protein